MPGYPVRFLTLLLTFAAGLIATAAPSSAELSIVPSAWSRERTDDAWIAISPPDAAGNQVAMVVPYVRPFSGNFAAWVEANAAGIVAQIVGQHNERGPLTERFRVKDQGGYTYGPVNSKGFWQTFAGDNGPLGAFVWAYPTNKGAQLLAVVFRNDVPISSDALEAATGVGSYADYARAVDQQEAAPDNQQPGGENCQTKTFNPYSYTRTECDFQGKNCKQVQVPMDSHVTVCN